MNIVLPGVGIRHIVMDIQQQRKGFLGRDLGKQPVAEKEKKTTEGMSECPVKRIKHVQHVNHVQHVQHVQHVKHLQWLAQEPYRSHVSTKTARTPASINGRVSNEFKFCRKWAMKETTTMCADGGGGGALFFLCLLCFLCFFFSPVEEAAVVAVVVVDATTLRTTSLAVR